MATPTIIATGATSGANPANISEDHYVAGENVVLTDPANTGATTQQWTVTGPDGAPISVNNATSDTADFDVPSDQEAAEGTYRIQHDADGDSGQVLIAVLTEEGLRIGGYLEQDDDRAATGEATWNKGGNTRGWHPSYREVVQAIPSAEVANQRAIGDLLRATLTGDQTNLSVNDAAVWNDELQKAGGVSLNAGTGEITLKGGRTYLLIAQLHLLDSGGFGSDWVWRDVTAGADVPGSETRIRSTTAGGHEGNGNIVKALVRPEEDTVYVCRSNALSTATIDIEAQYTTLEVLEIGAVFAESIGGEEYLDEIVLAAPAASVEFGATGDGVEQRALDSETDETYLFEFYFPDGVNLGNINVRPDGITANQEGVEFFRGSSDGDGLHSALLLSRQASTTRVSGGFAEFHAKKGKDRILRSVGHLHDTGNTDRWVYEFASSWQDQATEFASITIAPDSGSLPAGTRIVLRRRTSQAVRADSASMYERIGQAAVAQGTAAETDYSLGGAMFAGSAVGIGVKMEGETITSGSIICRLKVGGSTVLTATLTAGDFARGVASIGAHPVAVGDDVEFSIETSSLVTSGAGPSTGLVITAAFINDAFVAPPDTSGGGGGGDYLYASLSADQTTNLTANVHHVEFDQSASRGTSISLATGSGQANGLFTLEGGKTYEIQMHMHAQTNEGAAYPQLCLHPGTTPVPMDDGSDASNIRLFDQGTVGGDDTGADSTVCIYTPSVNTTVKVLHTAGSSLQAWKTQSRILFKEI